jgi:hypothetical protein
MSGKNLFLIGNGSLGSFAAPLIARFARRFDWRLHFVDFDKIEPHNLENQFFREKDLGRPKAEALAEIAEELSGIGAEAELRKADRGDKYSGIVIVLVDSMLARRVIWESCRYDYSVSLFVEARSGGDRATVYSLDPRDPDAVRRYDSTLYSDDVSDAAPCANSRQLPILYLIAGVIGEMLADFEERRWGTAGLEEVILSCGDGSLPSVSSTSYTGYSDQY